MLNFMQFIYVIKVAMILRTNSEEERKDNISYVIWWSWTGVSQRMNSYYNKERWHEGGRLLLVFKVCVTPKANVHK